MKLQTEKLPPLVLNPIHIINIKLEILRYEF